MKKKLLLILVCLSITVSAQTYDETTKLINSLRELWNKENPEEATKAFEKLNEISQPKLVHVIHNWLAPEILVNKGLGNTSFFLNNLYTKNNLSLNIIIEPIYLWNMSLEINTQEKATSFLKNYFTKLSDTSNYKSKTELYGLLIINEFVKKNIGNKELTNKILKKIMSNLKIFPSLDKPSINREINGERAWNRFLLAYSYNLLFDKNKKKEEYIIKAAKYSPDRTDIEYISYYSIDSFLLKGFIKFDSKEEYINFYDDIGYKNKYINFLNNKGKTIAAFNILIEETYSHPTNENLKKLKDLYIKTDNDKTLESVWYNYLNSKMFAVPKIKVEFESDVLDLSKKRDYWVYIDVWGTWCSPCIRELPEFENVARKYNKNSKSKIKFYTFSVRSKNLTEFMNKYNYTFPVSEIGTEIINSFNISSYPTKILISPDNKYLKIPFGVNWKEYMKNYCLIE